MGNLVNGLKKFLTDKNTVTILGVILGVIVLYIGYNYRINQKVQLTTVYYSKNLIEGNTQLTEDDIGTVKVNKDLLKDATGLITDFKDLQDDTGKFKYVNFNCTVPANSLLTKEVLINNADKPDSKLAELPEDAQYVYIKADMENTYGNAIAPDTYVNLYAYFDQDNQKVFAKFLEQVIVKDVIDGQWHTTSGSKEKEPDYLIIMVKKDEYELLMKAQKLNIELIPTVTNEIYNSSEGYKTEVSNEIIRNYIESKYAQYGVD